MELSYILFFDFVKLTPGQPAEKQTLYFNRLKCKLVARPDDATAYGQEVIAKHLLLDVVIQDADIVAAIVKKLKTNVFLEAGTVSVNGDVRQGRKNVVLTRHVNTFDSEYKQTMKR